MTPTLVFPDGRRVDLDDVIVVGRAPVAPDSAPAARSISVSVPTVSKTHALIGHDAHGVWLVDLHSSNGSEILDEAGRSERAVPGERLTIPPGSLIRIGTDAIITIDVPSTVDDDLDRTVVLAPTPPPVAPLGDSIDSVDWSAVTDPEAVDGGAPAPVPPQPVPPQPVPSPPVPPQPPPPTAPPHPASPVAPPSPISAPSATPTREFAQVPGVAAPVGPSYTAGATPGNATLGSGGRSWAHMIGAIVVLVWSAVGFANLRDWTPDAVRDAVDGRIVGFFAIPERFTLQFFEFFNAVTLPDSLDFLARGADIGPVVAILMAVVALIVPTRAVRWILVVLISIPIVLLGGILVTLLADSFDLVIEDIDRFIPWFVLPVVGSLLLLWPRRHGTAAPTPPQDVFYAQGQSPEPPFPGSGTPPFS